MEGIIVIGILIAACLLFARAMYKSSQGSCGCAACGLLNQNDEHNHEHNHENNHNHNEEHSETHTEEANN